MAPVVEFPDGGAGKTDIAPQNFIKRENRREFTNRAGTHRGGPGGFPLAGGEQG
jgi:hypothetical protein